ncbi:MAG: glutamate formimidoyltransferase [Chloroflexi bacterium]|nr:glutamate formimidoyltransferase [Chloroflexota bacterium]
MQFVECVPNFSEGRRPEVIAAIRAAAADVPGVTVLDLHADPTHNRMVLTYVGSPAAVSEAGFRCVETAARLIDMTVHQGEHPRMGATDVVPFIPLTGVTMDDCVALAEQVGQRIGDELRIPVYLYSRAARRPERVRLPDVRRGQYEGIRDTIETDPARAPDFGPARLGTAGATAVGARPFLVAYNMNLATADLALAKSIAKNVRESSGGLKAVQALGMATGDPNVVQVSMNLLDTSVTPLHVVYRTVAEQAAAAGVEVIESEIVGLLPMDVLISTSRTHVKARELGMDQIIEARLLQALSGAEPPADRA